MLRAALVRGNTMMAFQPHDMRPTDGTNTHKACVNCGRTLADAQQIIKHESLAADSCPMYHHEEQAERSLMGMSI